MTLEIRAVVVFSRFDLDLPGEYLAHGVLAVTRDVTYAAPGGSCVLEVTPSFL